MRINAFQTRTGAGPAAVVGDEVTRLHSGKVPSSEFQIPNSVRAASCRFLRSWGARLLSLIASAGLAWAQGTAFSYQGQLTDGAAAANGTYDLRFTLWNAATAGDPQGATLTQAGVGVTNGLFNATLDFGTQFTGADRWLEIAVRTNGAATFTTLAERQPILPTPYAIHAGSAATATSFTGQLSASQITNTLSAAQIPNLDASKITSGTFAGNGSGLTSLNASQLAAGTVPAARIPTLTAAQIPDLDAGKVTTGTFSATRIPGLDAAKIASGVLSPDRIPTLDASKISGGTFAGSGAGLTGIPLSAVVLEGRADLVAWGDNSFANQTNVPPDLADIVAIDAGGNFTLALRANGTVVAWGGTYVGQLYVPNDLSQVTSISAGENHSLALMTDGTVVAWGHNNFGQTNVPIGLSNVIAVAAGGGHSVALRGDGTLIAWGLNSWGATNIPVGLSNVVAVAAGTGHNVALRADGTVVAWGYHTDGQTNVPGNLTNVIAIAASNGQSMALKADGRVIAWGYNRTALPSGLSNVVAIAAGGSHSLALKSDGTVTAWAVQDSFGQATVPAGLTNVVAIAAGAVHSVALRSVSVSATNLARLDRNNAFAGAISAPAFSGNGSGLTSLNASALGSGTVPVAQVPNLDASKVTTGTFSSARIPPLTASHIPSLDASKITSGTFTGNGSGLTSLNASALTTGTVPMAQIPNLDASKVMTGTFAAAQIPNLDGAKIATGTVNDARLSANVALENGSPAFTAAAGVRVASFIGSRTGTFSSAVVHVENTETGTSASPALRVLGRGTASDGALSVSSETGRIARFGNSTDWVAALDNDGKFSATAFITLSDRNKKAGFAPVDVEAVLAKVAALPLTTWHYSNDVAATPHLGPMAQDFHAAFGLGGNDKTITTVDADGVALAAIQGLHRKTEVLAAENAELRGELTDLRTLVLQLQQQLNANRP